MRRLLLILICACTAALGSGQSIDQYLHLRKANGVNLPTDISALDHIVDSRVIELSTTIKGTFKVDNHGALMIDRADGSTAIIDCTDVPDWLVGNESKARLLIKVYRDEYTEEVKMDLLGAAPEGDVASHDKVPAAPKNRETSRSVSKPLASRHLTFRTRSNTGGAASRFAPRYADFILKINRRLSNQDAYAIAYYLIDDSLKYGVDARLIVAMVLAESSFNPWATSKHGAQGLGQLMPGTANGLGVGNAYDVEQNLDGMIRMVRGLLDKYKASTGDDTTSLYYTVAAYNAGAGAVAKYNGIPPYAETQNYVQKVVRYYVQLTSDDKS
jgi:hypothetical protein